MFRFWLIAILLGYYAEAASSNEISESQSQIASKFLPSYHQEYEFINSAKYVIFRHDQLRNDQILRIKKFAHKYSKILSVNEDDGVIYTPVTIPSGGIVVYELDGKHTEIAGNLITFLAKMTGSFDASEYGKRWVQEESARLSKLYHSSNHYELTCTSFYYSKS